MKRFYVSAFMILALLSSCATGPVPVSFFDLNSSVNGNYKEIYSTNEALPASSRTVASEDSCTDLVERILKIDDSQYSAAVRKQDPFVTAAAQAKVDNAEDKYPVKISDAMKAFRDRFLGWFKNPVQREPVTRSFEAALRMRSMLTKEAIINNGSKADYDLVIVGTGVHGVIALHAALEKNPKLRILLVDEGDTAGATFRYGKELFNINSSQRASGENSIPLPGRGNLNELPGLPIQLSDQTAVKYPTANDLGVSIVAGLYAAVREHPGVDVLFGARAKYTMADIPDGADADVNEVLKIVFTENPAEEVRIGAQKIFITTGLGTPKIPGKLLETVVKNPELLRLQAGKLPKVVNFEDLIRMLAMSNDPVKLIKDQKIGIAGSGDSANVLIEFLLGFASKEAYGNSTAQEGRAAKIYWIGQKKLTCKDFISDIRSRYQAVSTGYRSSAKDLEAIITADPNKIGDIVMTKSGKVKAALEDGSVSPELDVIVLTTGFEQNVRELLEGVTKGESRGFSDDAKFFQNNFETTEGQTTTSFGKRVKTGRKLIGRQIYVLGTAAGDLTEEAELVNVVQNFVSIFNNAPRVVSAVKKAAEDLSAKVTGFKASKILLASTDAGKEKTVIIEGIQESRTMDGQTMPYLKSVFGEALSFIVTDKDTPLFLTVKLKKDGTLEVHGGQGQDIEKLARLLASSREFFSLSKEVLKLIPGQELYFTNYSTVKAGGAHYIYKPDGSFLSLKPIQNDPAENVVRVKNQQIQFRGLEIKSAKSSGKTAFNLPDTETPPTLDANGEYSLTKITKDEILVFENFSRSNAYEKVGRNTNLEYLLLPMNSLIAVRVSGQEKPFKYIRTGIYRIKGPAGEGVTAVLELTVPNTPSLSERILLSEGIPGFDPEQLGLKKIIFQRPGSYYFDLVKLSYDEFKKLYNYRSDLPYTLVQNDTYIGTIKNGNNVFAFLKYGKARYPFSVIEVDEVFINIGAERIPLSAYTPSMSAGKKIDSITDSTGEKKMQLSYLFDK